MRLLHTGVVVALRRTAAHLALALLIVGPAMTRAEAASGPSAPASWQSVQFQGVSVSVPGAWPVFDLRGAARCARIDQHAVYLGHQPADTVCPARLVGRSEAVHLEPLDPSVATVAAFATQPAVVNGVHVRLDPTSGVTHSIVAAVDGAGVLLTITFRADRQLADQVLQTLTVSAAASPSAHPASSARLMATGGDTLASGATLQGGQSVQSANGQHVLAMQGDGNLVLYSEGRAMWLTSTQGNPGAYVTMQTDGNLVVYIGTPGRALWWSGTQGNTGASLTMQGDGNAVIYNQGPPLWSTGTVDRTLFPAQGLAPGWFLISPSEVFTLYMQTDGNLVLYEAKVALWSSGTAGNPGAYAIMQSDGNLVVYSPSGHPIWWSVTQGNTGARLVVQDDGNVVVYQQTRALWWTGTNGLFVSGLGFDTCAAPSESSMNAWLASPFRSVGVYIGGANRACPDGNLSASWVSQERNQGWSFLPLYVGLQAPCSTGFATIDPSSAATEGMQAADDALSRAQAFGILPTSPIFFDMEAYTTGGSCTAAVTTFLGAWSNELRAHGARAGVYSSLDSGIADLIATPDAQPDEIWFAEWDNNPATTDPAIPGPLWPAGRIKQYQGGHDETFGGVTINIDRDDVAALLR